MFGEERLQRSVFVPLSVLNYRHQFTPSLSKCVIESLYGDRDGKYNNEFEKIIYSHKMFT